MTDRLKIGFTPLNRVRGVLVTFCNEALKFGPATQKALAPIGDLPRRAAAADRFTGKIASALTVIAPPTLATPRLVVVGTGKERDLRDHDLARLGGVVMGGVPATAGEVTVLAEFASGSLKAEQIAQMALGARLRAYRFDRYKTKRKEGDERAEKVELNFACPNPAAAERAWRRVESIADGVVMARDLVNEPANVLYPAEFARRASGLRKLGVAVEVLDITAMRKLGMGALLGVGQGSGHESKLVIMRWNGGKRGANPVAFVGKGVCFDTGGISIKPAAGMEDMKGDMAGAACVVGLMHTLAARKARVNAVGAIGLVENMPGGRAQRPGDIVTSMSGQTIEVINTDAEGRLVLADVLHYVNHRFKPKFMINLATLTGAIMVALGQEYAGLFSNDDKLVERLEKAGKATRERVWPMPLGPEYDKMIDSKFADMKNSAGRWAGSITAAQFLQRFVGKTPWAHLDIAGTALGSPQTDINKSWSSGWGVRLLDQLVADYYER
ncbi:MAG: leucyl aminopeptidase [Hyphomicrobiales bacterium]|nr:leucyl aminopeptidase [Hyphomicrobiales bacterium]